MQDIEITDLFEKTGAFLKGHFKLSSGLHSGTYLQCALLLQNPVVAGKICKKLAEKFQGGKPDVVIGPAMGGIVLAYELARAFGARALFTERDDEGTMRLRRGFIVTPQNRVLIAEDVLTTGKSVNEVIDLLGRDSIAPEGIACLVDRSGGKIDLGGIRVESVIRVTSPTYAEEECPLCKEGVPLVKPGSRK